MDELKVKIIEAVPIIENTMLEEVWQKLANWLDMCHALIKHC